MLTRNSPSYNSPEEIARRAVTPDDPNALNVTVRSESEVLQENQRWMTEQALLDLKYKAERAEREAQERAAAQAKHQAEQDARHSLWADLWTGLPSPMRAQYLAAREAAQTAAADLTRAETALAAVSTPPERAADVPAWAQRQATLQAEVTAYRRFAESTATAAQEETAAISARLRETALARFLAAQGQWEADLETWRAARAAADAARDRAGAARTRMADTWEAIRVRGVDALPGDVLTPPAPIPAKHPGPKETK